MNSHEKMLENGYARILKTGKYRDSNGREHTFTRSRLQRIAEKYDPEAADFKEAPMITGHLHASSPSKGWLGKVKAVGDCLYAQASSILPDFKRKLKDREYKYVSISLRPDDSIRHLGFVPVPAVGGLGAVPKKFYDFGEDDGEDIVELCFEFSELENEPDLMDQLKQLLSKGKTVDFVDFSEELKKEDTPPEEPEGGETGGAGTEENNMKDLKKAPDEPVESNVENPPEAEEPKADARPTEERLRAAEKRAEMAEQKANEAQFRLDEMAAKANQSKVIDFSEKMAKEGKILPKHKEKITAILLAVDPAGTFDFNEETGLNLQDGLMEVISSGGVPVRPLSGGFNCSTGNADFSEGENEQDVAIANLAARLAREKNIPFESAVELAEKELENG